MLKTVPYTLHPCKLVIPVAAGVPSAEVGGSGQSGFSPKPAHIFNTVINSLMGAMGALPSLQELQPAEP